MTSKKYGLVLPDKTKLQPPKFQASRNVFGNDSDSEGEVHKKHVLLRPSDNTNRQAKICQEKAVLEDPTVYQYDEIYDVMTSVKEEKKAKNKEEKKPRYIENLLKSANKRKIENERRLERQIQKEREKEGDEFADKEVFVTSAYKKKLEEMSLEEEREKREEYLESIGDVTKQNDLGGFYRHIYEQKLGSDKHTNEKEKHQHENIKVDQEVDSEDETKAKHNRDIVNKRNYRKRKSSADNKKLLSEGEIEDSDDEINRLNLKDIKLAKRPKRVDENIDADSDFSIDISSDDESTTKNSDKRQTEINKKGTDVVKDSMQQPDLKNDNVMEDKVKVDKHNDLAITATKEPKPKIDIWKKRTVGEIFEQALKRYYERKAARGV